MSAQQVQSLYASMPAALEKARRTFGRPLTLSEKIFVTHCHDFDRQVWSRRRGRRPVPPRQGQRHHGWTAPVRGVRRGRSRKAVASRREPVLWRERFHETAQHGPLCGKEMR